MSKDLLDEQEPDIRDNAEERRAAPDAELSAIRRILGIVDALEANGRRRVIAYVSDRFGQTE